jgi:hypothetical protein
MLEPIASAITRTGRSRSFGRIAPEIHAIERPIVAPRGHGLALPRSRGGTAALRFRRRGGIEASCAHGGDFGRSRSIELGHCRYERFIASSGKALIAK